MSVAHLVFDVNNFPEEDLILTTRDGVTPHGILMYVGIAEFKRLWRAWVAEEIAEAPTTSMKAYFPEDGGLSVARIRERRIGSAKHPEAWEFNVWPLGPGEPLFSFTVRNFAAKKED